MRNNLQILLISSLPAVKRYEVAGCKKVREAADIKNEYPPDKKEPQFRHYLYQNCGSYLAERKGFEPLIGY